MGVTRVAWVTSSTWSATHSEAAEANVSWAAEAEPVLDWFHIAMRWQHVHQLASDVIHQGQPAEARTWLLDRIDREAEVVVTCGRDLTAKLRETLTQKETEK